ncbi:MAG: asparagine synthase-related protein [Solirubrobacteraceae bacterium]
MARRFSALSREDAAGRGVNCVEHLDLSMGEAARQVRARLEAAVRRRLVGDVPLGVFLSGGSLAASVDREMVLSKASRARAVRFRTSTAAAEPSCVPVR